MATNPRDSSEAVREFIESTGATAPDLGEPLSEDHEDPLLDGERIELEDEKDDC